MRGERERESETESGSSLLIKSERLDFLNYLIISVVEADKP